MRKWVLFAILISRLDNEGQDLHVKYFTSASPWWVVNTVGWQISHIAQGDHIVNGSILMFSVLVYNLQPGWNVLVWEQKCGHPTLGPHSRQATYKCKICKPSSAIYVHISPILIVYLYVSWWGVYYSCLCFWMLYWYIYTLDQIKDYNSLLSPLSF